jgi:hypothetical protein
MLPISGRIPEDLYQWLSTVSFEGATTVSDKLRVAMTTLRRLQDGDQDYGGALDMQREMCKNLRHALTQMEFEHGRSEVLAAALEHIPSLAATLCSARVKSAVEIRRLENLLVQRCFQFAESLLRQAVTQHARAYDPDVVNKHAPTLLELALIIQQSSPPTTYRKESGHE